MNPLDWVELGKSVASIYESLKEKEDVVLPKFRKEGEREFAHKLVLISAINQFYCDICSQSFNFSDSIGSIDAIPCVAKLWINPDDQLNQEKENAK